MEWVDPYRRQRMPRKKAGSLIFNYPQLHDPSDSHFLPCVQDTSLKLKLRLKLIVMKEAFRKKVEVFP